MSISTLLRKATGFGVAALVALAFSATGAPVQAATPSPAATRSPTSAIQHVVIIYQENHTFDDVLGRLCQTRTTPCDGYTGPVRLADGHTADNIVEPDIVPQVAHDRQAQMYALASEYDRINGCQTSPYACVTHVNPANIPNLATLARTYAVSDRTFAANPSQSFGAHVTLAAGTLDGFTGDNPVLSKEGYPVGASVWGCTSNKDAPWEADGNTTNPRYVPSCVPDQAGNGPYWNAIAGHAPSPVPYVPTVMQRVEQAGLTWHIYQGQSTTQPARNQFAVCTYFWWCQSNRFTLTYDSSVATFTSAAAAGTLPSLSYVLPDDQSGQHNGDSMAVGDNSIGTIVGAVQANPDMWNSTAIFITYDDCGCFYDHVSPPSGLGLRNPMVIVSPWVKPHYTDSTVATQPYSMLAFVQHTFGLASLTPSVDNAYDYSDSFHFNHAPLSPVHLTRTAITGRERARLADQPSMGNDPT